MKRSKWMRLASGLALAAGLLALAGCRAAAPTGAGPAGSPAAIATETPLPTAVPTKTALPPTATPTAPPTQTFTPTIPPPTPTPEDTATPTASPTPAAPQGTISMRAFCRYGPGTAYLYSHELKAGDVVAIDGRSGSWLWVQPANLNRHCWAAASVMEVAGDVNSLPIVESDLPASTLYGPPTGVQASRSGDTVTITWNAVWMTEDDNRGYMVEASVCQGGARTYISIQTNSTGVDVTDEAGCDGASSGRVYTVEKHGYTAPAEIPWP